MEKEPKSQSKLEIEPGMKFYIKEGQFGGNKVTFSRVLEKHGVIKNLFTVNEGDPNYVGKEVVVNNFEYLIPLEKFKVLESLPAGTRIKLMDEGEGVITDEKDERYPDDTIIVLMDGGKKRRLDKRAEVLVVEN